MIQPMAKIEPPDKFARRIGGWRAAPDAVELIRADRRAVARAVLERVLGPNMHARCFQEFRDVRDAIERGDFDGGDDWW